VFSVGRYCVCVNVIINNIEPVSATQVTFDFVVAYYPESFVCTILAQACFDSRCLDYCQ
jgi:hypothetical protein